jgi:RNA polymerase sigma-70 factor (ECF subfamily)
LGISLHRSLLEGNSITATAQIAEAFLPPLIRLLGRNLSYFPDHHQIEEEAAESLLNYFESPEKFDPRRGSLLSYLYMDASANLKDSYRRRKKVVLDSPAADEYTLSNLIGQKDPGPAHVDEDLSRVDRVFERLPDSTDQELLRLMMEGERKTEAFAALLGIQHLDKARQAEIVQRHKDRVKKTARRQLEKHERGWLKSALRRLRHRSDEIR